MDEIDGLPLVLQILLKRSGLLFDVLVRLLQDALLTGEELLEGLELLPEAPVEMGRHPVEILCLGLNVLTQGLELTLQVPQGLIDVPSLLYQMVLERRESLLQIGFQLLNDPLLLLEALIDLLQGG